MTQYSDSTIIKGMSPTGTDVGVAVNADGEILTATGATELDASDVRDAVTTNLLEEILVQLKIQNQYLLSIVGHSNEVFESDAEVRNA